VALDGGAVVALRPPDLLLIARPDGTTASRKLPPAEAERVLIAAGARLGMIAGSVLALSDDEGATWSTLKLPESAGRGLKVRIEPDGTIRVAIANVTSADGGQRTRAHLYRASLPEVRWTRLWTSPADAGSWAFGDGGWLYAYLGDDPERMQLVAVAPSGKMRALTKPSTPDVAAWPYSVVGNGHAVVADIADTMARLTRGKLVSPRCWGEKCLEDLGQSSWPTYTLRAVDRHGLPLVQHRNHETVLMRLSRAAGERALFSVAR
jgi:hypothetical protein